MSNNNDILSPNFKVIIVLITLNILLILQKISIMIKLVID